MQKRSQLGLILYCHLLKILAGFTFELVFCKWSLMGQYSLHENGGGDTVQYECAYECACPLPPAVYLHVVFEMPHAYKVLVGVHQVLGQVHCNVLCLLLRKVEGTDSLGARTCSEHRRKEMMF